MLHIFRSRGIANVVYGVIILAMILVFVIQFRPDSGKRTASCNKQCMAMVRGWCIESKSYHAARRLLLGAVNPQASEQIADQIPKAVLDGLVERELLISEAERLGITVSDDEINKMIFAGLVRISLPSNRPWFKEGMLPIPEFRDPKTKEFDVKNYKTKLKARVGLSEADFREEQRREAIAGKMRDLVRAEVRISDTEAYEAWLSEQNTALVDYLKVNDSYVARWGVKATDEEIATWAKANQAEIDKAYEAQKEKNLPKEGRVRHILAKFNDKPVGPRSPPVPGSTEEKAFALARLSLAYARLKKGESFAELARELSDDSGSIANGGAYEAAELNEMQTSFRLNAMKLQPGELTHGVVETTFGYHLLMKDDPKAKPEELEPAIKKGIARNLYLRPKIKEMSKALATKLAASMKSGKTADEAIKETFAAFEKGPFPQPTELLPVLSEDGKTAGDAGAASTGDAGVSAATDAGKTAATGDAGAKAVVAATFVPANDPFRPMVITTSKLTKGGDAIPGLPPASNDAFVDFAFSAKPKDVRPEPIDTTEGWVVVQLKERSEKTKSDYEKDKAKFVEDLLEAKQTEALALYLKQLRDSADKANEVKVSHDGPDGGVQAPDEGEQ